MKTFWLGIAGCVVGLAVGGCGGGGASGGGGVEVDAEPDPRVLNDEERQTAATLLPGDVAPPIGVRRWVKGDAVGGFVPGVVYVIDFWAVWCGPCLASMPHTSELQEQYGSRAVMIGMTKLDAYNTDARVDETIAKLGEKVRFRIAVDDGATTERYPVAVRDTALPRVFIVDGNGRFAWCGHPMDAAPVVKAVVEGTWDLGEARRAFLERADAAVMTRAISEVYITALRAGDVEGRLRAAEACIQYPVEHVEGMAPEYWGWTARVECLVALRRVEDAKRAAAEASVTAGVREEAYALAQIAESLRDVALGDASRYADQAMERVKAVEKGRTGTEWERFLADGEERRNAAVRIIAAEVRASEGRRAEAAELLRVAIPAWTENERAAPNMAELRRRLAAYEAGV